MATEDAAIKKLKNQMAGAVMNEKAHEVLQGLRILMADCQPVEIIGMAMFLGEEIAVNPRIHAKNRQDYVDKITRLIQLAFFEKHTP